MHLPGYGMFLHIAGSLHLLHSRFHCLHPVRYVSFGARQSHALLYETLCFWIGCLAVRQPNRRTKAVAFVFARDSGSRFELSLAQSIWLANQISRNPGFQLLVAVWADYILWTDQKLVPNGPGRRPGPILSRSHQLYGSNRPKPEPHN